MLTRLNAIALSIAVTLLMVAGPAMAQRPPSPGQGPPQMSVERAWNWFLARPGVMIAVAIMIVAVAYMVVTRARRKT